MEEEQQNEQARKRECGKICVFDNFFHDKANARNGNLPNAIKFNVPTTYIERPHFYTAGNMGTAAEVLLMKHCNGDEMSEK